MKHTYVDSLTTILRCPQIILHGGEVCQRARNLICLAADHHETKRLYIRYTFRFNVLPIVIRLS